MDVFDQTSFHFFYNYVFLLRNVICCLEMDSVETVFVILFLAVLLFVVFRLALSGSDSPPQLPNPSKPSSANKPPAIRRDGSRARFNAQGARHLHEKRVLNGAAFVTDGDTIKINGTQVRLFGVDAPELNHPYGKKAKWALHKLCKGQTIRAVVTDVDTHGRTVAHCYLPDGRDLSAEMVKLGLAIDWEKFSGGVYKKLETSDARKKLWLADARQNGRIHVWKKFEANKNNGG